MTEREAEIETALVEMRQRLGSHAGSKRVAKGDPRRELLARIEADAGVAARASERLPPVMSDRRGWLARAEIALKRIARSAANWFTWEQVNFNTATADALRAAHALLKEQAARESELRGRVDQLEAELEEMRRARAGR